MARIRTIKPEFPQSETIGSLSRDARLLFLQLFTIVDDEGRARGASRMLASLLYPHDDDVAGLIDGWLDELEAKNSIRRYQVNGSTYLEIVNWLIHQKIDKPSKSRLPAFVEGSRSLARPREASATDLVSRTLDLVSRTIDDDDEEPAAPLVSKQANEIADEIGKLCGYDPDFVPPSWCGAPYAIQRWLNATWPPELILASVREQIARKRDGPPSKVEYFEKGIAAFIARQSAPVPIVEIKQADKITIGGVSHETTNSLVAAQRRLVARANQISGGGGAKAIEADGAGSGEGAAVVRLLPKG